MNVSELREKLNGLKTLIEGDSKADPKQKALALIGFDIAAELLLDIKRIADAAERGGGALEGLENRR